MSVDHTAGYEQARDEYRDRIAELEEQIRDRDESARRALSEECAPDERHCSCVPTLRGRIAELEAEVEAHKQEYRHDENVWLQTNERVREENERLQAEVKRFKSAAKMWQGEANKFGDENKRLRVRDRLHEHAIDEKNAFGNEVVKLRADLERAHGVMRKVAQKHLHPTLEAYLNRLETRECRDFLEKSDARLEEVRKAKMKEEAIASAHLAREAEASCALDGETQYDEEAEREARMQEIIDKEGGTNSYEDFVIEHESKLLAGMRWSRNKDRDIVFRAMCLLLGMWDTDPGAEFREAREEPWPGHSELKDKLEGLLDEDGKLPGMDDKIAQREAREEREQG